YGGRRVPAGGAHRPHDGARGVGGRQRDRSVRPVGPGRGGGRRYGRADQRRPGGGGDPRAVAARRTGSESEQRFRTGNRCAAAARSPPGTSLTRPVSAAPTMSAEPCVEHTYAIAGREHGTGE